ncbi:eukaryotic peptide chain release factor GTP-binding subunit ERF3A-like [Tachypleus tridentatus]|uniref:eukaryotic peptide chain release factor GTP-binding subunit ERF3A-like n=1 Tax=Tachypleus tridentatus TaxID=6853 RepID=UPI003FD3B3CB
MVSSGDSIKIKLKGVEEEEVQSGFVLCDADNPCTVGNVFDAQFVILVHCMPRLHSCAIPTCSCGRGFCKGLNLLN